MQYASDTRQMLPQTPRIKSVDFGETIEIEFSTANPYEYVLTGLRFTTLS